ncbi:S-layer homology domain-containing protein [Agathobaculum desmolans]|uniref:S-layer homology domain-containing protein n=1 Tax=Agathobaculum desmolans TaxID=39484 RepID=UPI00248EAD98|nr:S-layer homology domain-containing protein [Agathobaculum desmolans]
MVTKKLFFPALLLVLWLIAATAIPQSYAAGGTHRVDVQSGTGYTSGEVGVNVWETGVAKDVSFVPMDGYRITSLTASYGDASASAAIDAAELPTQFTVGSIVLPLKYAGRTVTVTVPGNCTGDLTLSATAEAASCKVAVTADSGIDVSGGGTYGIGKAVTITAAPSGDAAITRVQVTRTDAGLANTADLADGAVQLGEKTYPFSVTDGKVTMILTVEENLGIHFFSNGKPDEQPLVVRVSGEKGVDPVSSRVEVRRGNDVNISADTERGYEITEIRLENGTQSAIGYVSEERIWLDGKVYRISRENDRVTLRLTDVQTDMQVYFISELDEDHIPVTVSEGMGVDIDKDCGSTVSKGTDVRFTISAETSYRLSRITLSVDGISRTVDADEDEITVDGIDYKLQQSGADVILYVDDVYAPVKVSATASKLTTYDHSVTIGKTQNCTVSASRTGVNNGGSVTFTVTPQFDYQLSTVTLRVGSQQATASADSKTIKVGSKNYSMSLSGNGILKVTVSGIRDDVQLSAYAAWTGSDKLYLLNGITAPYFEGMGNNRFCPENTLTRAEAAVMLARLTNYSDLTVYPSCGAADVQSGSWYTNAVNAFYDAGIETASYFRPNAAISRAELSVWLYRLSGSPYVVSGTLAFPDVATAGEMHDAVAYGQLHGWINGYPDGTFRPNHSITRAEAAKLINRVTGRSLRVQAIVTQFTDVPASHWAYREIVSAANQVL